jgi:hypothetical protein
MVFEVLGLSRRAWTRDGKSVERIGESVAGRLAVRFFSGPAGEEGQVPIRVWQLAEELSLARRAGPFDQGLKIRQRSKALEIHADSSPPRDGVECQTSRVRYAESEAGLIERRCEFGLAV